MIKNVLNKINKTISFSFQAFAHAALMGRKNTVGMKS